ncbi:MAG TPA: glycosyltransferase [Chloroflexota bacterium]|nr:glycosyltransferase [Chloroflexota bacterium]
MRILFVTQIVDRSHDNLGAVHGWIDALARQVETVHVLALNTGVVDLPPNVFVHSLGKDLGNGKLRQLQIFNSVAYSLALRRQVDVFFPHMVPRYALLVAPYRLLFRIPTVMWYAHNSADLKLKSANLCVDRFVTVTRDSFPLGSKKCSVVGHGVDTSLFRPAPEGTATIDGKVRFLSLCRISPRKELDTFVSAADLVINRWGQTKVQFIIAGGPLAPEDHTYLQHLKDRVKELKLEEYFLFTGGIPHSETVHRLQSCDYFVNMHVEGGLGKAVLEAMSCGLPAFVSTPTYYEHFSDYGKQFLFAPRDPVSLAERMKAALEMSAADRIRIGADLRDWVCREHDLKLQMSRIARVMEEVKAGRRPSTFE